jgi:hypothetical protein
MTLSVGEHERLKELLKTCTALVTVDDRPKGTAFFVSERLLLTCEHVVGRSERITVTPFKGSAALRATLVRPPSVEHDVALLEIQPGDVNVRQPCVALDEVLDDTDYCIAGFPKEEGQSPGIRTMVLPGGPRQAATSGLPQLLDLDPGKNVTWGNSGGPVLNLRSGAVVAIVRTARNPTGALGGGAVPVATAVEVFEEIKHLVDQPPPAVRAWRDILGRHRWQALNKVWNLHARVDVEVSRLGGGAKGWRIGLDPPVGLSKDMIGPELGEDVGEALFRWAQRRRIREDEEVELLGRLLAGALFPQPLAEHLSRLAGADEVVVRLKVESGSDLADIPWELSAVPGTTNRFLAADDQYRFVRVLKGERPPADGADAAELVPVLSVVALPTRREYPVVYGDDTYPWPSTASIAQRLQQDIEGAKAAPFRLTPLVNPLPGEVKARLEEGPYTIFHFMGVGRLDRKGRPQIALVNERNPDSHAKVGPKWESLEKVLGWAADNGAVVAVLEFLLPWVDSNEEPMTLSVLNEVIPDALAGVVATRFPVHPVQAQTFNEVFYAQLRDRESVETAVQLSRYDLQQNKPVEDGAGFGWFTLVTRCRTEIRLLVDRPSAPSDPGRKTGTTGDSQPAVDVSGPGRVTGSQDAYHR